MDAPSNKPLSTREDAFKVVQTLRANGFEAYFAGGCVRDLLRGATPKDYDVATNAPPTRVRELFKQTQAVGQAFGVILVRQGKSTIEVATFRADGAYDDGRRPNEVRFTTAEEDAQRRDFTINGLFLDPIDDRVIDFVGGQEDLKNHLLRAIGDAEQRFAEDYLRMLRAVRFAARLDFQLESKTADAIRHHANKLRRISPERIGEELRLMLCPPTRSQAWNLLAELHLDDEVFRLWPAKAEGVCAPLMHQFSPTQPISFGCALAIAWLSRTGSISGTIRDAVRSARQLFKISNEEFDEMQGALEGLASVHAGELNTLARKKRFLARPTAAVSIEIARTLQIQSDLLAELDRLSQTEFAPTPLINGDDLVAAGLTPGKAFKELLDWAYDEQLEGRLSDKSATLAATLERRRQLSQS